MAARSFSYSAFSAVVVTTVVLLISSTTHISAQPLPPASGCTPAISNLSPCLGFITGNSSAPSSQCCSQLTSVVQTQARCLCLFLNQTLPVGLPTINQTQALTLPGACKIQTPPLSQCNAIAPAGAPGSSPMPAPSPAANPDASPSAPTAAPADANGSSKTVGTNGQSSGSSSSGVLSSVFLVLAVSSGLAASFSGF